MRTVTRPEPSAASALPVPFVCVVLTWLPRLSHSVDSFAMPGPTSKAAWARYSWYSVRSADCPFIGIGLLVDSDVLELNPPAPSVDVVDPSIETDVSRDVEYLDGVWYPGDGPLIAWARMFA